MMDARIRGSSRVLQVRSAGAGDTRRFALKPAVWALFGRPRQCGPERSAGPCHKFLTAAAVQSRPHGVRMPRSVRARAISRRLARPSARISSLGFGRQFWLSDVAAANWNGAHMRLVLDDLPAVTRTKSRHCWNAVNGQYEAEWTAALLNAAIGRGCRDGSRIDKPATYAGPRA